jgi:hypothetical protein
MPWNRIKTNRLVLANGLGKSLAAIQQSRVKGLIGVPEHLEAQDYMAIIIPRSGKISLMDLKSLLYTNSLTPGHLTACGTYYQKIGTDLLLCYPSQR